MDNPTAPGTSDADITAIAQLEELDDIVFPAIDGDQNALKALAPAWHETVAKLGPEAVRESRRQYLRHARATLAFLRTQAFEHPHHIFAVVQIIMMLSGDDAG